MNERVLQCPDCDFRASLFLTVCEHMLAEHRQDHPGETPWMDHTERPSWEDLDVMDQ